jgi:hypothetical protein
MRLIKIIPFLLPLFIINSCAKDNKVIQSKGLSISNNSSSLKTIGDVKKEALLIGISNYVGKRDDLNGIERDVNKMKKLFESWGFNTKVLYDSDSLKIVEYLDKYAKELGPNDYFGFYYSGHGSFKKDENQDESDGKDETLVLSNGDINEHLLDDTLYTEFNKIKAKKMIFFDSCHSGTAFRAVGKAQPKTIEPTKVTKTLSKGLSLQKR